MLQRPDLPELIVSLGLAMPARVCGGSGSQECFGAVRAGALFRVWWVTVNRRVDNHREDMARFGVRRLADLSGRIIPFFEEHPLFTAKRDDFMQFSTVVGLMCQGLHLRMEGLALIADIAESMNRRKPSRLTESSEAIRRPSDLDGSDEDMVLASWRHGG
jgi:hypothetical protein